MTSVAATMTREICLSSMDVFLKTCFKCKVEKPCTEFYKHPQMGDGYIGKCKECNKIDVQENYAKRREQYSDYDAMRYQTPHRKQHALRQQKKARDADPQKASTRRKTAWALRTGKLIRQPCEKCGTTIKVQAHHEDYSKPLDVMWLCFQHHREHHGQIVTRK